MSFFPWSKKDKKSKEKKGGSVAASSSVVASSPASASSNEISKFLLNFKPAAYPIRMPIGNFEECLKNSEAMSIFSSEKWET